MEEKRVTRCSMLEVALKHGSFVKTVEEQIAEGNSDDFRLGIYLGVIILEAVRISAYVFYSYSLADLASRYLLQ